MRFLRFFLVILAVTLLTGTFGGVVGGLVGFAVPSSLRVMFGMDEGGPNHMQSSTHSSMMPPTADAPAHRTATSRTDVGVAVTSDSSMASAGAAMGAASGLVLGVLLGIVIGIADQIILALSQLVNRKTSSPAHAHA